MKKSDKILESLMKSAKQAPQSSVEEAPFGFSTRVVAQWSASREKSSFADAFQFLSLRAFSIAACIAVASIAFYIHANSSAPSLAGDFLPSSLTLELLL